MPRINIEDKLMIDPRFVMACIKLGDRELAMGIALNFFQCAQKFYVPKKSPIPNKIYDQLRASELWLEVGLAKRVKRGTYICGSKANFAWLIQCHEAASKSVESRKKKANDRLTSVQPLTPTLPLTHAKIHPPTPLKKNLKEEIRELSIQKAQQAADEFFKKKEPTNEL